ncbi:MAG: molybdenum cofactor biosynthesis protein MoaE, partial [Pseudomonadota bacterium]
MRVVVQSAPFDLGAETTGFAAAQSASGAVVTFSGIVRDVSGGLSAMEIEHYPGMTERALSDIASEAVQRWSLEDALVIHRHGTLRVGEQIMMVATAAPHRAAAFEAADFLMDY